MKQALGSQQGEPREQTILTLALKGLLVQGRDSQGHRQQNICSDTSWGPGRPEGSTYRILQCIERFLPKFLREKGRCAL